MYFYVLIIARRHLLVLKFGRHWNEIFWKHGSILQILPWNKAIQNTESSTWWGPNFKGWALCRQLLQGTSTGTPPESGLVSDAGCEITKGHIRNEHLIR